MNLGQWLNSLSGLDHFVILILFLFAAYLSRQTIIGFQSLYNYLQETNPYGQEFRTTPFFLLIIAIIYTIIFYKLAGGMITNGLAALF